MFVRGGDNQLWHKWYDGGWSGWEPLGGVLVDAPRSAQLGPGRLDVVVRGTDNQLWHRWFDGRLVGVGAAGRRSTAGRPRRVGHQVGSTCSCGAATTSCGTSGTTAAGRDGNRWAASSSTPAAASLGPGRLDVVVRGTDNQLWHTWFEGAWSDGSPSAASSRASPGAASWGRTGSTCSYGASTASSGTSRSRTDGGSDPDHRRWHHGVEIRPTTSASPTRGAPTWPRPS